MGKGVRAAAGPRARAAAGPRARAAAGPRARAGAEAGGRGQRKCVVESLSCNICHHRYVYMEQLGLERRGVKIVHRNYVIHSERRT